MPPILPPELSQAAFDSALAAFEGVVGADWVLSGEADRDSYLDPYALGDGSDHAAAAAVAPASAEEVQAVVRIANEHKVPLWPVSRGKNLGYGGAAPVMPGTVVLDLGRMNRILEINEKQAYALLEPGVGFYDLFDHLQANGVPLWMSAPSNGWGSVVGNALDRGVGYTPYGDHTAQICGLEVVLPDGSLVRTGHGGMANSPNWNVNPYGFGPSWDQMFVQSNFGVVTKAGMWLMPEPEATMAVTVNLPEFDDLAWAVDTLAELKRRNVVEHQAPMRSPIRFAATNTQRKDWYDGPGALPDEVLGAIADHYGIGIWDFSLRLFGYEDVVQANANVVRRAIEPQLGRELEFTTWRKGEPIAGSGAGVPSVMALQVVNWWGGRGGHIGFSPVMPTDGALCLDQARRMKARFDEHGIDYYTSFTMGTRYINNINMILYDRDDPDLTGRAKALFRTLIADNHARGYGEYRTHIGFMDEVAASYDFNDHALRRLNEKVKDALDPNGIIAPGRNGVWPAAYRSRRA
jgi:4-cresol dehydrogenase (hydroxylating)